MIYESDKYTIEIEKGKDKIEVKPPGHMFDAVLILQYLKGQLPFCRLDAVLKKEIDNIKVKDIRC